MSYQPDHHKETTTSEEEKKKYLGRLIHFFIMSIFFIVMAIFILRIPWIAFFAIIPWGASLAKRGVELFGLPSNGSKTRENVSEEDDDFLDLEDLRDLRRTTDTNSRREELL